jgi:hypothetical protein
VAGLTSFLRGGLWSSFSRLFRRMRSVALRIAINGSFGCLGFRLESSLGIFISCCTLGSTGSGPYTYIRDNVRF